MERNSTFSEYEAPLDQEFSSREDADDSETSNLLRGSNTVPKSRIGVRHVQIFMASTAIMIAYILRVNMSVAIVAMTDTTRASNTSQVPVYKWSEAEKSQILSSFFWGYPLLQIPVGNMAEKYGSKMILFVAMISSSALTVIVPYYADSGYKMVCALRVLQGAAQGSFFPCVMVLLSKWIPPSDRGRALTLSFSGSNVGTLIAFPFSGYLASTTVGWPSIFYVTGGLGFLWAFLWFWIGASAPNSHSFISEKEQRFIETSMTSVVSENNEKLKTPWKQIVMSVPLWAIFVSHLGQNWGYWTLLTEMPNYINSVLGVDIKKNGILSALPYVCGWTTAILFSWISQKVQDGTSLSKTVLRKIWNSIGLWGAALVLFILGMSYTRDAALVVFLLMVTVALNSGVFNGFLTNHIEVSPNFCGTLMGITNSLSNITSILGPLTVGWLVSDPSSQTQWKYVFILASSIMFGANLIYIIFGSSEVQSWNDPHTNENRERE